MLEVMQTFARREVSEQVANGVPEGVVGTGGSFAQHSLELGEDLFEGIKVCGILRQIKQDGARSFDGVADPRRLYEPQGCPS
jgi:hypothetical protein